MTNLTIETVAVDTTEAALVSASRDAVSLGLPLELFYRDSKGDATRRTVTPERIWRSKGGDLLLTASCHLRGEGRSFKALNVLSAKVSLN